MSPNKNKSTQLMMELMEFYDDIDVDFGDKDAFGVGEAIAMMDQSSLGSKPKSAKPQSKKKNKLVVFEDDVGSEDYERYNPPSITDYSLPADPDLMDSIAREVEEVTGNALVNQNLENHYRQQFPPPKPKKSSKKRNDDVPKIGRNITTKSDLRKEMAFPIADDSKITFVKKNRTNAVVSSVALAQKKIADTELPKKHSEIRENDAEEEEKSPVNDVSSYRMDRVRQWVNNIDDSFEDEFYSANDTNNTDSSLSYCTASETETPKRRATSKRNKPSPKTNVITDASVGFKVTSPAPKPAPKPIPKPASSKSSTLKKKADVYIPGPDNSRFKLKMADFPAIR